MNLYTVGSNTNLSSKYGSGGIVNCSGHLIISGSLGSEWVINAQTVDVTGKIGDGAVFNVQKVTVKQSGHIGSEAVVNGHAHIDGHVSSGFVCTGTQTGAGARTQSSAHAARVLALVLVMVHSTHIRLIPAILGEQVFLVHLE